MKEEGEAGEEGGEEPTEEGGEEPTEEGGEEPTEEGGEETTEEGGEEPTEEGGEEATEEGGGDLTTWSETVLLVEGDCAPCHFGGYAMPFDKDYVMANWEYMITRIENGSMPVGNPTPVVNEALVPALEAWAADGFLD